MPLPKGFRKNIKLTEPKIGPERRQELLDAIDNQGTFLPRGVHYEDMDKAFVDYVNKELQIEIDGEKVPVIFLTIQRWAEFSKTWQYSDEFKDIQIPFITIVRRPDIQVGTNQAGMWNIPQGRRLYTYVKVPSNHNGRIGVDLYKIPQPVCVDITYEVRLFCNKMRDLNKLYTVIHHEFQSRQVYINPNGHPMPLTLEVIGDESPVNDFENRRFYVQSFEMLLAGYIVDENRFEVIPTKDRMMMMVEAYEGDIKPKIKVVTDKPNSQVNYSFVFRANSTNELTFRSEYNLLFELIMNESNLTSYEVQVNSSPVTIPFTVNAGDTIYISITPTNPNEESSFNLIGKLI